MTVVVGGRILHRRDGWPNKMGRRDHDVRPALADIHMTLLERAKMND